MVAFDVFEQSSGIILSLVKAQPESGGKRGVDFAPTWREGNAINI